MDTHVKERLTGAIILVGVLVLLIPELLTGPKRASEPARTNADEAPLRSYTIDLNEDPNAQRTSAPPVPNKPEAAASVPMGAGSAEGEEESGTVEFSEPETAAPTEEASGTAANEPKPASVAKSPADAPPSENAAAQALALAASKDAAKDGASGAGEKAVASKGGSAVGEKQPESAKTAKDAPAKGSSAPPKDAGVKAASVPKVAALPPSDPVSEAPPDAEASRAAKPASGSGYSVQLGVFASRKNADRLASELKGKGFSASVSESKSRGKKLYKVRVGPEADRSAAQAVQTRLRAAGHSGSVVAAR